MSNNHINDQVKNYYQDQTLSSDKMDQLLNLADSSSSTLTKQNIWRRRFSIAASVCIFALITLQFAPNNYFSNYFNNKFFNNKELATLVSEEIALNHNKQLAIEFSANSFAELREQMKKLDFTPVSSTQLANAGFTFLGARYCSIQGQLAAQIKLKNKDGIIQTLYQTQLNNKLKALPEKSYVVNGVRIKQWQEKGIFFGLAITAE